MPSSFPSNTVVTKSRLGRSFLILLAILPPLFTAPGIVPADTKQYLYLNPGQLLRTATSLWDPSQFGGYVTHQTIGYLWPAGPWYWLFDKLGTPDWIAQRLWLGALFVAAGQGIWRLCRVLGLTEASAFAAAALYQLSPYVLSYANRTSILLSPWAGLGWILAYTILATRRGGWRYAAAVALVVATVGGINATALVLIAVAPVSWLIFAVADREVSLGRALTSAAKIAVLSMTVSIWWIVALVEQSKNGADVLAFSETTQAVSFTSSAPEVVRGLGYWLFYGNDVTGLWNSASSPYVQSPGLILLGFGLSALMMAALFLGRASFRRWVTSLWLIGVVVAVGAHGDSWFSRQLLSGNARSTLLLAFRSSTRAVPLILLAGCLAVAVALTEVSTRRPSVAMPVALGIGVLAVLQLPAIWNGTLVDRQLRRPEQVPVPWVDAANALEQRGAKTRVLELPGQEFSAFRWGTTTDQLLPGLMTRPTLTRDLLPLGSPQLMDTLFALDNRLQDGTLRGDAIAPIARLLSVGDVVVRGDERFEKYQTPRPERVAALLGSAPTGLGPPRTFGTPATNAGPSEQIDAVALTDPGFPQAVPAATIYPVVSPSNLTRTESTVGSVLISGSGDGLVGAADLLVPGSMVRYSADAANDQERKKWVSEASLVVITDSNRKRAEQWRGSQNTVGFTEDTNRGVLVADPADVRLARFSSTSSDTQTLAQQVGGVVQASSYGEPNAYRPEDRAVMAFDGDPLTFWRVSDRADAVGQRLEATFTLGREASSVVVRQPSDDRKITEINVTTDAGVTQVTLGEQSWQPGGQRLGLPAGLTGRLSIEIAATTSGHSGSYLGEHAVGLDIATSGPPISEVVRLPVDITTTVGEALTGKPLAIVLQRERADATSTYRHDPESRLVRKIDLPTRGEFTVSGSAHPADNAADSLGSPTLSSSGHLVGADRNRVTAAFDNDPSTRWISALGQADGAWVQRDLGETRTIDHLVVAQPTDNRFSHADTVDVRLDGTTRSAPIEADGTVRFPSLTGRILRVKFHVSQPRSTIEPHFRESIDLPVAVSSITIDGVAAAAFVPILPSDCRSDLVMIDDIPIPVRVAATGDVSTCEAKLLTLSTGSHRVETEAGVGSGIDIDRLVLRSGTPIAPTITSPVETRTISATKTVSTLAASNSPVWLVFGQGWQPGWHATVNGHDLGLPAHVDGGSMAWPIDVASTPTVVTIEWQPQRWVYRALLMSLAAAVVCLALVLAGRSKPVDIPVLNRAHRGSHIQRFFALASVAVLGAAVVSPMSGGAALIVGLVALRVRELRRVGLIAAIGATCFTGIFIAGQQFRHRYLPSYGWPQSFNAVHHLALLAIVLLVVDSVVCTDGDRHFPLQ